MIIAFDLDGTLIDDNDQERSQVTDILKNLYYYSGAEIVVWSGGGKQYAEMWGNRLGLPQDITYMAKTDMVRPDLAFDDQPEFNMADRVVIVHMDKPWEEHNYAESE